MSLVGDSNSTPGLSGLVDAGKLTAEQRSRYALQFLMFDTDCDGRVSMSELGPLLRSLGMNPSRVQLQSMERLLDTDGTGFLTREDFFSAAATQLQWPIDEEDVRDALQVFDTQGTGYFTVVELRHILGYLGERLTEEEINEIVEDVPIDSEQQFHGDDLIRILMQSYPPVGDGIAPV